MVTFSPRKLRGAQLSGAYSAKAIDTLLDGLFSGRVHSSPFQVPAASHASDSSWFRPSKCPHCLYPSISYQYSASRTCICLYSAQLVSGEASSAAFVTGVVLHPARGSTACSALHAAPRAHADEWRLRMLRQELPPLVEGGEEDAPKEEPVEEEFDLADVLGEDVGGSGSKEELLKRMEQELVRGGLILHACACAAHVPQRGMHQAQRPWS